MIAGTVMYTALFCAPVLPCVSGNSESSFSSITSSLFGLIQDSPIRDAAEKAASVALHQASRWISEKQVLEELQQGHDDLQEDLFCAQLSTIAYALDSAELNRRASELDCNVLRFQKQPANDWLQDPQWFTCERLGKLYVVFRGTFSVSDGLADILVVPQNHTNGDAFHSGFLNGAKRAWQGGLRKELLPDRVRGRTVTILGHSFGGALALALLGIGVLPTSSGAHYRVVTFGAPAVFHGDPKNCALLAKVPVTLWVLEDDWAPRLLGSEYPVLKALIKTFLSDRVHEKEMLQLPDQLAGYTHLKTAEVRLLREGKAFSVPAAARRQVLHIHGALLSLVLNGAWHGYLQHSIYSYVDRIKDLLASSQSSEQRRWTGREQLRISGESSYSHTDF